MFSTKVSHLACQSWLLWLTSLAKLVSCQFNARRVKRGYFLTARHVQFCRTPCTPIAPIATLPIEPLFTLYPYFLILECQLVVAITWSRPPLLCVESESIPFRGPVHFLSFAVHAGSDKKLGGNLEHKTSYSVLIVNENPACLPVITDKKRAMPSICNHYVHY